ncbi:hypothetical protein NQ318_010543 [Aromia moschata]|uniref:Vesicular glutamate transporter 1 n=1 Tax=Aromia moschata TaxID=1265417 RepID=A0AAV8YG87_9CUCU|nr:hypothetical protein NQ318_010543 [Aromia moschata]
MFPSRFRNQYQDVSAPAKKGDGVADDASTPESFPEYDRPPLRLVDQYIRAELPCFSKRATVAFLSCVGFIIMFGMRTSMSLVKVKMQNVTNNTWTPETLSAVDSAIFWGYFVTQIPGGLIAAAYPANKLFGAAIGSSCLLNLCIPLIYNQAHFLIIIKVMQGLVEASFRRMGDQHTDSALQIVVHYSFHRSQQSYVQKARYPTLPATPLYPTLHYGVTYPACHGIMRYWAPPLERSRLATLAFSGCYAGVMFAMAICGELIEDFGTLSPFYFYGVLGILWYLSWLWLVFEKPAYHTCIEAKELMLIENSLGDTQTSYIAPTLRNTPWMAFFTSMPCYAIFVANFCRSWNFYLLVLFQASYFEDSFKGGLVEDSLLGALPHFFMTVIVQTGGILADRLRKKGILTTTQVRKLFNCGGFGMEATFFLIMAYSDTMTQGMTALSIGVAFSGFAISGFNVNHLDIAPRYASILMGMSNGIGTIAGCICPFVVHKIVRNKTREEWRIVFIMAALIHYSGIIFYAIFASGELQPWADPRIDEEKQWNQMSESVPVKKSPSYGNGLLQRQPTSGLANYGAMETPLGAEKPTRPPSLPQRPSLETSAPPPSQAPPAGMVPQHAPMVSSGNPFISSSNPFRQEQVQPVPQDTYLHGTIDDRTY